MTATSLRDLATTPTTRLLGGDGAGTTAWVVELGRELYVRSMPGAAPARGRSRMLVDGVEHPVLLTDVAPEVHGPLDDAFRAKYGRCTPQKVEALTSDEAAAATYRIGARRLTWAERTAPLREKVRAVVGDRGRVAAPVRSAAHGDEVPCVSC